MDGRWTKKCSEVRVDGDARDARGAPRARSSRESPRGRARRARIVAMFDPDGFRTRVRGVPGRARLSNHRGGGPTRWTRRFGARGGGKRGGAPRVHLQLLHAAVVSLIVETTFARHICGRERAGRRSEHARDVRDLPAARRARTHHREKTRQDCGPATPLARSTGIRRDRRARRGSERPFARGCPSGTTQRRRRRERDEMRAPAAPRTLSRALVRHARRSGFAAPAANGGGPTSSRGCAPCGPNAHLFGLRLRNRAFVTKGTCDARGRRAARVSDVAARRVSRRGTSGGCALANLGRRVV